MAGITRRPPIVGRYTFEEVALAARNSGMPLEGRGELSVGASSIAHLGDPGVGDPTAGVEIP